MATLEMTPEEAQALQKVVKTYLSDLHTEISRTDDRDFRAQLKEEEELLKALLPRLA